METSEQPEVKVSWAANIDGGITFASSNLQEVTGLTFEQISGMGWMDTLVASDRQRIRSQITGWLDDPRPFSGEAFFEHGSRKLNFEISGEPIYDENRALLGYLGEIVSIAGPGAVRRKEKRGSAPVAKPTSPPKANAWYVPRVSFDMDGTLCNIYQGWLNMRTRGGTAAPTYDWQDMNYLLDGTSDKSEGKNRITRSRLERYKVAALSTPDFYATLEPFDPSDITMIKWCILGRRIAAVFIATRREPLTAEGQYGPDAMMQSLAWLEGAWAQEEVRDEYSISGYMSAVFDAKDKVHELTMRGVRYHLDDNPQDVAALRAAGIEAFLIDRPWNHDDPCAWRVASVSQFLDTVAPRIQELEAAEESLSA